MGFYNPPCALDCASIELEASVKSPKSTASPVVIIITWSIVTVLPSGVFPPPLNILVEFEQHPGVDATVVKSPKSVEFPVDAIVTYSILFVAAGPT